MIIDKNEARNKQKITLLCFIFHLNKTPSTLCVDLSSKKNLKRKVNIFPSHLLKETVNKNNINIITNYALILERSV
jgi:putative lipase involved disintegration of autophagic bodies